MAVVVLDAGHGGSDLGATYQGRQEKDDTLALTLAVGRLLAEDPDIDVVYTRETDMYDTPLSKPGKQMRRMQTILSPSTATPHLFRAPTQVWKHSSTVKEPVQKRLPAILPLHFPRSALRISVQQSGKISQF